MATHPRRRKFLQIQISETFSLPAKIPLPEYLPADGKLAPFRDILRHQGELLTKTKTTQSTFNDAFGCSARERFEFLPLRCVT